ncbi:6727_t:CDS:1, partial [Gigaspora rosea]
EKALNSDTNNNTRDKKGIERQEPMKEERKALKKRYVLVVSHKVNTLTTKKNTEIVTPTKKKSTRRTIPTKKKSLEKKH